MKETSFSVVVDEHTVVQGLSGSVYGPMVVESGEQRREVDGRELELWLNDRGADVRVIDPASREITYFAKIGDGYPRSSPRGIVRRRFLHGIAYDEAFTRNLRWEPTEYLRLYELGQRQDRATSRSPRRRRTLLSRPSPRSSANGLDSPRHGFTAVRH